jgi:6-pyruvoyltetrahydropterin/6-carboxytetrahydropterin synthase
MGRKVKLTRRVTFSAGHRYWFAHLSPGENKALFGVWASPYSHGHNYVLYVTVEGLIDPEHGMVVNIKTIDDVLKQEIVSRFDGKSVNDELEHFRDHAPTAENIMRFIWDSLSEPGVMPHEAKLTGIRLDETETLYGELDEHKMTLTRTYEFAASHRLHVPSYSMDQNVELFGKCNNPAGHGHNYVLEVTVSGEPDARTGMMVSLEELDRKVNELVVDRYDHKHLNEDIPEFRSKVPTSEVVAEEIFNRLNGQLPVKLQRIRLLETARNIFEVEA